MNTLKISQKYNSKRGTVLFIVLIFVIAITLIVLTSHLRSISEIDFIRDEIDKLIAYSSCYSGAQFAINRILTSSKNRFELLDDFRNRYNPRLMLDGSEIHLSVFDLVNEKFHDLIPNPILDRLNDQKFTLQLQDSAGLINFFRIRKEQLIKFFENIQISKEQAQIIIDSAMDWMDADDFVRQNGAEKDFYLKNNLDIPPNRLIYSLEELLLIRGINPDVYQKIKGVMDFTFQNRGVNPNTMPKNIFQMLFGLNEEQVTGIINSRMSREFRNITMLTQSANYNFSNYRNIFQFFTSNILYVKISARMEEFGQFFLKLELNWFRGRESLGRDNLRIRTPRKKEGTGKKNLENLIHIQNWLEGTEN